MPAPFPRQDHDAEQLYAQLQAAGVEVCHDDRAMSPGAKFKDHELIGLPVQVFVGRNAADGKVELLVRKGMDKVDCGADEVVAKVQAALAAQRG